MFKQCLAYYYATKFTNHLALLHNIRQTYPCVTSVGLCIVLIIIVTFRPISKHIISYTDLEQSPRHTTLIVITYYYYAKEMKERVSKLTYPMLQHCLTMLHILNGNAMH